MEQRQIARNAHFPLRMQYGVGSWILLLRPYFPDRQRYPSRGRTMRTFWPFHLAADPSDIARVVDFRRRLRRDDGGERDLLTASPSDRDCLDTLPTGRSQ